VTIRFDDKARRLTAGVRDLVAYAHPRGAPGSLWMRLGQMTAGQRAHRERQSRQAELDLGYRSEIPASGTFEVLGYTATVRGRIDGLRREEGCTVVEEIKSLFAPSRRLRALGAEELEPFVRQMQIYALLVGRETGEHVRGELVLVSLADNGTTRVEMECDLDDSRKFVEDVLRSIVRKRLAWLDRLRLRREVKRIPFAHDELRPEQRMLHERMLASLQAGRNVLISAPAGVGKTAAALAAALEVAYARDKRLFFLTSKTTQQRMAAETLRRMRGRGLPLRAIVLAAREKMCLHDPGLCGVGSCPYMLDYFRRSEQNRASTELISRGVVEADEARAFAERSGLCAAELSLDAAEEADVVVCDYNYVFHPTIRLERFFAPERAGEVMLVVDEAHNLYGRAMEYFSPELHSTAMKEAARRLRATDAAAKAAGDALEKFARVLTELAESRGYDGNFMETSFDVAELAARKEKLEEALLRYFASRSRAGDERAAGDPAFDLYRQLNDFCAVAATSGEESSHVIKGPRDAPVFKVLCKDPSGHLGSVIGAAAGCAAMSATLEPLEFFRSCLGFEEEPTDAVRVGSPFAAENRLVVVARWIDTRFRMREGSYPDVARLVRELRRTHSGNYIVFAPSYAYVRELAEHLAGDANVLVESREGGNPARGEIIERLATAKGAVVVAVAGGSLAEGVDYPGRMCEGVVVAGPALPRVEPERELIRAYYDEQGLDGFAYAYVYPGMIRVVQSAGRLIRAAEDRGVLVLADRRFAQRRYKALMPPDWLESLVEPSREEFAAVVRAFWENP